MRFTIESWAPEYGISGDESQLIDPSDAVDATIELPLQEWVALTPQAQSPPSRILFVDGVRRIDARIWFHDAQVSRPGVCASVAAGVVSCAQNRASVTKVEIVRGFFAAASASAGPISTKHGVYGYFACAGDTPEDVYLGIHEQMTAIESRIASGHDADLVVFDGPLRGRRDPFAIGYVKTQQVQYLPDEVQPILTTLLPGQRTPIFLIGGRGFVRYSWYLRLLGPIAQPMSGIVRCELVAEGTVSDAALRADAVAVALPKYASHPHKDPRAPQNLYPISGLEHRLRHLLGDQLLLERSLRRAAALASV